MALDAARLKLDVRPLVAVTRGERLESLHYGALAVCDAAGELVAWVGDAELVSFLRSTAKPLQAVPFLESGAAAEVQDRDVALACASHAGSEAHVAAVADFQRRVDVAEAELRCGSHRPYDRKTVEQLIRDGLEPTPNHHNCSGKHTAMLATASHLDEPRQGYLDRGHPVQRRIQTALEELSGFELDASHIATDGCSAPNFALPLRATATSYARLADPSGLPPTRRAALDRIYRAMTEHPNDVAGEGRLDSVLMQAGRGRVLAKSGAEGYLGLALRPQGGPALGVALKIVDGDLKARAKPLVALELLRQLEVLTQSVLPAVGEAVDRSISSHRGEKVGALEAIFQLERA